MTCICLHTPHNTWHRYSLFLPVPVTGTVPGRQLYEDFIYLLAVFSMLNPPTSSSSFFIFFLKFIYLFDIVKY